MTRTRRIVAKWYRAVRGRVQPGDRAVETFEHGRLVITFLPARHRRSMLGRLAGTGEIADFADYRDSNRLSEMLER